MIFVFSSLWFVLDFGNISGRRDHAVVVVRLGVAAVIIIVLEIDRLFFTDDLCQSNSHFVGLRF
jgi:hypothetical protein